MLRITENLEGHRNASARRIESPTLIGLGLLGGIAFACVVGAAVVLGIAVYKGDVPDGIAEQVTAGITLLGTLASAAVGGIAGMLTLGGSREGGSAGRDASSD